MSAGAQRIIGRGATEVVTAPERIIEWTDGKGFRVTRNMHGKKALVHRYAKELMSKVDSLRIVERGDYATLEAFTTDEQEIVAAFGSNNLNVYWECDPGEIEKDLRTHPFLDGLGADKAEKLEIADKAIEAGTAASLLEAGVDSQIDSYIRLRLIGVESYPAENYVLRRITVCGNSSAQVASWEGVNEVTTEDPSKGKAVNPNSRAGKLKFKLPAGEWLKRSPQVYEVGRGKFHIVETWWWAQKWSGTLYEGGSGEP